MFGAPLEGSSSPPRHVSVAMFRATEPLTLLPSPETARASACVPCTSCTSAVNERSGSGPPSTVADVQTHQNLMQ